MDHPFFSDWYAKNRERLLPIRRKYNKGYSKREYVIEKAKIKNSQPKEILRRKLYKKSPQGKIANKRYYNKHLDKIKRRQRGYRLKMYNITEEGINILIVKQEGKCAICQKILSSKYHIDHCHKKNKVRGLLCSSCNMGLGLFKDDKNLLIKVINYLDKNG